MHQRANKKLKTQSKRMHRPKNVNYDYLRNVLVKFLILSEYLTDDQIVLVPVLASILRLGAKERQMIDEAYNSNSYFMGANTLFPESANARPPSPRKRRKKKVESQTKTNRVNTNQNKD